jgi:hypothetical protein
MYRRNNLHILLPDLLSLFLLLAALFALSTLSRFYCYLNYISRQRFSCLSILLVQHSIYSSTVSRVICLHKICLPSYLVS